MAPKQVRLSGINYFYVNGKIGNTERYLEKFLNLFDCTVYPCKRNCVYHTEIVHSFSGYVMKNGRKSIRRPSKKEIFESVKSNILSDEIELIKPKVLLLIGNTAYVTFYKYFLKRDIENNLTRETERISESGEYYVYDGIPVIPIQHSSGVNPRFNLMLRNQKLIDMIVGILDCKSKRKR